MSFEVSNSYFIYHQYKCLILNPHVNTNLQKKTSENINMKILDQCINRLCDCDDLEIACIKMQLLLEHDYKNKGKYNEYKLY